MRVSDFTFSLPENLIATSPKENRVDARLLHVSGAQFQDKIISDIVDLVRPGDLLIANNTQVIPARLEGYRDDAYVNITLHKQIKEKVWTAFAKPAKKLRVGDLVKFADDFSASVLNKDGGEIELEFHCPSEEFFCLLEKYGDMPLPPYIAKKREPDASDKENYQTIFAEHPGAVAAPTAGLHFTEKLMQGIKEKGVSIAYVTLHVGGGTFLPVKVDDTKDHVMHSEYGEISPSTAALINATKQNGGRIVAVGTTSLRILESCVDSDGYVFPFAGETDIFITPGYRFKVVDCLLTNFHLPSSTLFMLVCAFSGVEVMKKAYLHAVDKEYRFYSYGDACFLERA